MNMTRTVNLEAAVKRRYRGNMQPMKAPNTEVVKYKK